MHHLLMGEKKIEPNLISRIQDRRGKTIFKSKKRECLGCDKFINDNSDYPIIKNMNEQVLSEETAYQMVTILNGAVKRELQKN